MSDKIVIELGANAETIACIGILGVGETRWVTEADLAEMPVEGMGAIVILHGACVAAHNVVLPSFTDSKVLKILPGLMEEKLSTLGVSRHFALLYDRDVEQGARLVCVVNCAVMDKVIQRVKGLGLKLQAVLPDYTLLSAETGESLAVKWAGKTLVRLEDGTGFTAEDEQASFMVREDIVVKTLDRTGWQQLLQRAEFLENSLLQGAYALRENALTGLLWFKRVAVLASAALVIWVISVLLVATSNQKYADSLYADAEKAFRKALPEVSRIVNMEAQMRRAVAQTRHQGGGELFSLSEMVFRAVEENPETMLETLRYDRETGSISISVSFASFAGSERFKSVLQRAGARVAEGGSRQEASRVFSEISIERAD